MRTFFCVLLFTDAHRVGTCRLRFFSKRSAYSTHDKKDRGSVSFLDNLVFFFSICSLFLKRSSNSHQSPMTTTSDRYGNAYDFIYGAAVREQPNSRSMQTICTLYVLSFLFWPNEKKKSNIIHEFKTFYKPREKQFECFQHHINSSYCMLNNYSLVKLNFYIRFRLFNPPNNVVMRYTLCVHFIFTYTKLHLKYY